MRKQYLLISAVCALLTAACSSPKYTYNFGHYDYNIGRKSNSEGSFVTVPTQEVSPLVINEKDHLASSLTGAVANDKPEIASTLSLNRMADRYEKMSKSERRNFRRELKNEVINYANELKSGDQGASITATKELDDELKLAIIFGAIGITLTVLGGINTVFWVLGVVGLVIGLVFFIRWISRQ